MRVRSYGVRVAHLPQKPEQYSLDTENRAPWTAAPLSGTTWLYCKPISAKVNGASAQSSKFYKKSAELYKRTAPPVGRPLRAFDKMRLRRAG